MMSEICYFEEFLPAELKQILCNYLNVEDLLSLCLACKSMNNFIGRNHDSMKKIWIKFYSFKLKDLESLASSVRNYEKLKVNRVKNEEHFEFLANLEQPWRKILIYNTEFKSIKFYLNFAESFSETVEELEISDIEILNNRMDICPLKFPRLKRIMFRNVPSTAIEVFLEHNKKLENAAFDIVKIIEEKIPLDDLILRFLNNSLNLKHLQLGPHYIKSLFDRESEEMSFDFKLSKLFLKFPIIRDASPDIEKNVCSFFSYQNRLDWILFFEIQNDGILKSAWNEIPSINHLTFIGLEELFDDSMDLTLNPNENIFQLELLSRKILISQLRKLLQAAPKLQILHVHTLTKYIMEFTAKNHKNIRELRYENIDEEVPEIYNQLKVSSVDVNESVTLRKSSFWRDDTNPFSIDPNFWHA